MAPETAPATLEPLFLGAVDGTLAPDQQRTLEAALAADPALRLRFEAYRGAVGRLQAAPRLKAPEGLEALVLRRSRRRRFQLRGGEGAEAWRIPAEVLVPLLLGVLAALLYLGL